MKENDKGKKRESKGIKYQEYGLMKERKKVERALT